MIAAVSRSPANQDRPLLHPSPLPSDQRAGGGRMRTLLDLLTVEKMDGLDHSTMMRSDGGGSAGSRWRILKERLGLRVVGCCGVATWRYGSSEQFPDHDQNDAVPVDLNLNLNLNLPQEGSPPTTRQQSEGVHTSSGINLAAALAAEREFRATEVTDGGGEPGGGGATPLRVSLMRLLEETVDGGGGDDLESEQDRGERKESTVAVAVAEAEEETVDVEAVGSDRVCCVCMGRRKGAAFIPCGHTYCRTCSRELWLNRGSCPLCNQRILEILDIF